MNNRLVLNLIHRRYRPQRGFALPMALMIGVVGLVVAATMLIRGQADQNQAVSQNAKTKSMAAAEAGLARVQSLMGNVKFIALYPMSDWGSAMTLSSDKTTVSLASGSSIANYVNKVASSTACSSTGTDVTNKENAIKAQLASLLVVAGNSTSSLDANDTSKGKYRVVGYTYSGTAGAMPGTSPQTGSLIIQGESGDNGASSAARIAVNIPVSGTSAGVGASDVAPGLWIKKGGINTTGSNSWETSNTALDPNGNRFDANVLFSDCSGGLSDSYVSSVQSQRLVKNIVPGATARKTNLSFPLLPPNPSSIAVNLGSITTSVTLPRTSPADATATDGNYHYTLDNSANTPTTTCTGKGKAKVCTSSVSGVRVTVNKPTNGDVFVYNNLGSIDGSVTVNLPRSTDVASSDGIYRYLVNSIGGSSGNSTINVSTSEEVNLYVLGDVKFNGSGDLNHNCEGVTDCSPSDLEIFAYATSSATPGTGLMCLKGNARVDGLILAPAYDLGKTGGGSWYGSLFGYSWGKGNCGSNNGNTPSVIQTGTWSTLPSYFQPSSFSPQLGNFTAYQQQPVQ